MRNKDEICIENLNDLIQEYRSFLIKIVSDMLGRYVSVENDDEYSIALAGFVEAVERYDRDRGAFMSFARLVIESRIKNYWEKNRSRLSLVSMDELNTKGYDVLNDDHEDTELLKEEIQCFKEELTLFGLSLEILAEHAPKHRDTRIRSLEIAKKAGEEEPLVEKTYEKKKLPIREVARFCHVSEKLVKGNKYFILGSMIIVVKRFLMLSQWIRTERC